MGSPRRAKVIAAFAAIYIIWGSTYLGILLAIETIPPFLMAGARFFLAGLILLALTWRSVRVVPTRTQLRNSAAIGLLLLFGGNGAVVLSEKMVPSGLAALLVSMVIVWVVLLDWASPGGKKPTKAIVAGLVLGVIGLLVLVGPSLVGNGNLRLAGIVLLMFGSLSWAAGTVLARHIELPKSGTLSTAVQMLAAGVAFLLLSLIMREHVGSVSTKSLLGFLYLVTFGSLVAFSAFVWLLKVSTPAKVATYAYVNPVVALFLGWAFAGEALSLRTIAASAIIIGAVALITTAKTSA
jgi:drug/metabolite transporter (DMT)-like permease